MAKSVYVVKLGAKAYVTDWDRDDSGRIDHVPLSTCQDEAEHFRLKHIDVAMAIVEYLGEGARIVRLTTKKKRVVTGESED